MLNVPKINVSRTHALWACRRLSRKLLPRSPAPCIAPCHNCRRRGAVAVVAVDHVGDPPIKEPRWRCRRPSRRACMCMFGRRVYQCRRKSMLRPLTSHTAAPNARGRFRRHADWRCTELAGAARDSALPPDGASSPTKPSS